jgi:hypothetical protein
MYRGEMIQLKVTGVAHLSQDTRIVTLYSRKYLIEKKE